MAFSKTDRETGSHTFITDVAAATADTATTISHGLKGTPTKPILTPLTVDYFLSEWFISGINSTSFKLTKRSQSLSGNTVAQVRVCLELPHTITV